MEGRAGRRAGLVGGVERRAGLLASALLASARRGTPKVLIGGSLPRATHYTSADNRPPPPLVPTASRKWSNVADAIHERTGGRLSAYSEIL